MSGVKLSTNPQSSSKASGLYFGALDGFRGLLAVTVAIFHTYWYSHINETAFFNNGPVIIDLFFVFSGFLMYVLYSNRMQTADHAKVFLKRRFARLYPIHIFMLLVFVAYGLARVLAHSLGFSDLNPGEALPFQAGSTENFFSLLTHLTMTHSMGLTDTLTFNPPSWTISVEFFAYFTFVLMFMRFRPTRSWHFALIAAGISVIYAGLAMVKPNMDITYDLGFFRCLGGFYTGILAAWAYGNISSQEGGKSAQPRIISMTILELITLASFVAFVIYMPGKLQFFVAPFAFTFVLVFAFDGGLVSRFMSLGLFRYLAKISYSVYMIHTIFAFVFNSVGQRVFPAILSEGHWAGDLFLVFYLVVVLGSAHLTWMFIERPGQKLLSSLSYTRLLGLGKKAAQ